MAAVAPFVKYAGRAAALGQVAAVLTAAHRAACSGRPGGAYVDLPSNVLLADARQMLSSTGTPALPLAVAGQLVSQLGAGTCTTWILCMKRRETGSLILIMQTEAACVCLFDVSVLTPPSHDVRLACGHLPPRRAPYTICPQPCACAPPPTPRTSAPPPSCCGPPSVRWWWWARALRCRVPRARCRSWPTVSAFRCWAPPWAAACCPTATQTASTLHARRHCRWGWGGVVCWVALHWLHRTAAASSCCNKAGVPWMSMEAPLSSRSRPSPRTCATLNLTWPHACHRIVQLGRRFHPTPRQLLL